MDLGRRIFLGRERKVLARPSFLAVLALGLCSLALMLWADRAWTTSFRRTVPLLDNLLQARESLAEGHVWLEERLRGNRGVDAATVHDAYDQALAALEDSLRGRSAIRGLPGIPPEDPALLAALERYREVGERAREIARARGRGAVGGAAGASDLQLLSAFHALGLVSKVANARLQDEIRSDTASLRALRTLAAGLWAALLVGVTCLVFVFGRREVAAEESLRAAHATLEHKVEERTAELSAANARLRSEVEERRRAEEALGRSEAELRLLSSRLLAFQESERARLARELHDRITQTLVAVLYRFELASQPPARDGATGAPSRLDHDAVQLLRGTLADLSTIYMDLRPSLLDDLGLLAAADWYCRRLGEEFPALRVVREWSVEESAVPDRLKVVLYRMIEESLKNVVRHSRARTATVRLGRRGERLELSIEDDGIGPGEDHPAGPGLGLGSMRQRAEEAGGTFEVEPAAGGGTRVSASWPTGDEGPRPAG